MFHKIGPSQRKVSLQWANMKVDPKRNATQQRAITRPLADFAHSLAIPKVIYRKL